MNEWVAPKTTFESGPTILPRYPALYQINTRVYLTELSHSLGRPATLDDIPHEELDRLCALGFDWVWLLSVWRTGEAARQVSRASGEWRHEFQDTLPDLREEDIGGSGFAIASYTVNPTMGGAAALARLRERLRERRIRLMLDFVPNHTALDHEWVETQPEFYVAGTELKLAQAPHNYLWVKRKGGDRLLAHGRDPYFPGWPDTLQLNYGNPTLQEAMIGELEKIAVHCDGVRCDMAMLVLPDVFERTWDIPAQPFWPRAIKSVREQVPGFCFMAEVYWDLEWIILQNGFDYAYDKRLYDRLRGADASGVRAHLRAGLEYQRHLVRFLENHDEPRAASAFIPGMHQAAAIITFLTPGLQLFHQGQFEGRKKHISPHLVRAPVEPADAGLQRFYTELLGVSRKVRGGDWQVLECAPAWDGNWTSSCFLASSWEASSGDRCLVVVNYSSNRGQCYVRLPWPDLAGSKLQFKDLMSPASYDRNGNDLAGQGLYLDLPPWGFHVFEVTVPK